MRRLDITAVPAILIGILITSTLVAGCNGKLSKKTPKAYPVVIVAIDRSGSTNAFRDAYKLAALSATAYSADNRILLGFYAVDRKAVSIEEPRKYEFGGLSGTVNSEIEAKAKSRSVGTRPLAFWQEMNERFGKTSSPVYIAFLTDGGNDYAGEAKSINALLKQFSKNQNVHIALLGINPEFGSSVRRDIAPFGSRGQFTVQTNKANKEDLRAELTQFIGGIR